MELLLATFGALALGLLSQGQSEKIPNGWVSNKTDVNEYDTFTLILSI